MDQMVKPTPAPMSASVTLPRVLLKNESDALGVGGGLLLFGARRGSGGGREQLPARRGQAGEFRAHTRLGGDLVRRARCRDRAKCD
jgi:hypothetical protein